MPPQKKKKRERERELASDVDLICFFFFFILILLPLLPNAIFLLLLSFTMHFTTTRDMIRLDNAVCLVGEFQISREMARSKCVDSWSLYDELGLGYVWPLSLCIFLC